ncbi:alpha-hydroxy acid oxidase [Sphingomonas sp. MMS24-JH45]
MNVAHRVTAMDGGPTSLAAYIAGQFDRSLTWRDLEWLAAEWGGPLAVKGILSPEDAVRSADAGADTVMVSNHGARQIETATPPIEAIARIADAVRDRMTIVCDGGVRRGLHIAKALAMGAHACSVGRPYLYGLAAGGEAGVTRAIAILREEFERSMILSGIADVTDFDRSLLSRRPAASTSFRRGADW